MPIENLPGNLHQRPHLEQFWKHDGQEHIFDKSSWFGNFDKEMQTQKYTRFSRILCHTFDVLQLEHAFINLKCEPWRVPGPGLCNDSPWRTRPPKALVVELRSMKKFEFDAHQKPTWKYAPEASSEAVLWAWWPGAHFLLNLAGSGISPRSCKHNINAIFSNVLSYVRCFVIRTCIPQFRMRALTCSVAWLVQWHVLMHQASWEEHKKMWKHERRKSGTEKNVKNMRKVYRNRENTRKSWEDRKAE